jgi:hypothetical protein
VLGGLGGGVCFVVVSYVDGVLRCVKAVCSARLTARVDVQVIEGEGVDHEGDLQDEGGQRRGRQDDEQGGGEQRRAEERRRGGGGEEEGREQARERGVEVGVGVGVKEGKVKRRGG